jgi:hypothetical protein
VRDKVPSSYIGMRAAQLKPAPPKGLKPKRKYLVAHACFRCRKSFKVASRDGPGPACPQCAAPMVWMGRAFAAPPTRNKAQWRKLEALVRGLSLRPVSRVCCSVTACQTHGCEALPVAKP